MVLLGSVDDLPEKWIEKKDLTINSFYPAEHLYAHETWRMSSSAEVNADLNKKENALWTWTSRVTLETACEHCKSPSSSTAPLATQEIQLNDLRVSTN